MPIRDPGRIPTPKTGWAFADKNKHRESETSHLEYERVIEEELLYESPGEDDSQDEIREHYLGDISYRLGYEWYRDAIGTMLDSIPWLDAEELAGSVQDDIDLYDIDTARQRLLERANTTSP